MKKMKFVEVGGFGMYVKDKPNAIDGAFVGMFMLMDDEYVGRKVKDLIEETKKSQEEQIPF